PIPHLLALFDDTLDHYQKACQSNSASIVRRLGTLRETLLANLPTIANTFVEQLQTQPNLVRLSGSPNEQYFCFGDLHGSLTDLIYLRQLYWRKFKQLQDLHFVFLGESVVYRCNCPGLTDLSPGRRLRRPWHSRLRDC